MSFRGTRRALFKPVTASVPYFGVGDQVLADGLLAANHYWALRAYALSTVGMAAVRLIRSSDSAPGDIGMLANGNLNVGDSFFDGSTYKVSKWYNQGSDGATYDASQATDANRPTFVLNVQNGKPVIRVLGSSSQFLVTGGSTPSVAQPNWVTAVVKRTGAPTAYGTWFGESGGNVIVGFNNTAHTLINYAGTVRNVTANDGDWHAVVTTQSGAASAIYVDGTDTIADANVGSISEPIKLFTDSFGDVMTGDCGEIGHWNSTAPDVTKKLHITSNQTSYWGF